MGLKPGQAEKIKKGETWELCQVREVQYDSEVSRQSSCKVMLLKWDERRFSNLIVHSKHMQSFYICWCPGGTSKLKTWGAGPRHQYFLTHPPPLSTVQPSWRTAEIEPSRRKTCFQPLVSPGYRKLSKMETIIRSSHIFILLGQHNVNFQAVSSIKIHMNCNSSNLSLIWEMHHCVMHH